MTTSAWTITCTGRAVDARNEPTGEPCGKPYPRRNTAGGVLDRRRTAWSVPPMPDADYLARARVAGWAVHVAGDRVDAMCPTCRRPTRETTALLRDLQQSIALPEGSP